MKIIIIILICLFFSLSIPNINEFLIPTAGPPPAPIPTAGPSPQNADQTQSTNNGTSLKSTVSAPAQPESGLQTQVNLLSSSVATTNAIALEAKKKVDDISSQIEQLKEQLKKAPTD